MNEQSTEWPSDIEFRKFAALVADGVMLGMASGFTISNHRSDSNVACRLVCPLGAVLRMAGRLDLPSHPCSTTFAMYSGQPQPLAFQFICGFAGDTAEQETAAYRLGQEYRAKFSVSE